MHGKPETTLGVLATSLIRFAIGFLLWNTSFPLALASDPPQKWDLPKLHSNETEQGLSLFDKSGKLVLTVDPLGRIHTSEVFNQQRSYDIFLAEFQSKMGWPHPQMEFVPPQPQSIRGVDLSSGKFVVPEIIFTNGVMDRDTLAIPFYETGLRLVNYWNMLEADSVEAQRHKLLTGGHSTNDYCVDWRPFDNFEDATNDPYLFQLRLLEIRKAMTILLEFQGVLQSISMITSGGQIYSYKTDLEQYTGRLEDCRRHSASLFSQGPGFVCQLCAEDLPKPPDWLTEHIDGNQITPQLVRILRALEMQLQAHLEAIEIETKTSNYLLKKAEEEND